MNDLHTPQISLFSEHEEPQSYEVYVYGTDDLNEQNKDSFCVALCRYLDEINISQKTLARLTGIAPSTLSRYLSGKRKMQYDYLCAVCIAIRLHPSGSVTCFRSCCMRCHVTRITEKQIRISSGLILTAVHSINVLRLQPAMNS